MNTSRVKQRLQTILKQRGVRGVIGLQQSFNEFDLDKNGTLSWEEFNFALQKCGLAPSPQDSRALFLEFDVDGSNEVSYDEFIRALRGDLSAKRRNIITRVFESIDSDGDGIISMTDIGACFNPKNHPEVKSGKTTVPILLKDFFETFNTVTNNGYVSLDQFLEYYTNAAFFEDDSTFETTMASVWSAPHKNTSDAGGGSRSGTSLQSIASSRAHTQQSHVGDSPDDNEMPAFRELKTQLKARGARGIIGLARKFRLMDDNGNKVLDMSEFKKGIRESGLKLSEQELNQLYAHFDQDRSGGVDYEEFLHTVRGNLSSRRKFLVNMAFDKMDKDGNGTIDPEDVIDTYDASKHPDVLAGKKTSDEVLREFLDTFDVGGEVDGKVTRSEFMNYYSNVGASIDDDDYFELMIRNAWHISGGEGWSANSANRRVLVTHADGRQSVEEIKDDMGLRAGDSAGAIARLRKQGMNASSISFTDGSEEVGEKRPSTAAILGRYSQSGTGRESDASRERPHSQRRHGTRPASSSSVADAMAGLSIISPHESSRDSSRPATAPSQPSRSAPSAGLQMVIEKLKQELKSRGGSGFIGLQRKFRILDDDGSKALNMAEFKKGIRECNLNLSEAELRMLFDHFDADCSGSVDFEEFVRGVRDPLNGRRVRLIHMAFSRLDKDGSGLVDADDIAGTYDASKHPDVLAGKKSSREVLEEFLDTFDVGGEVDGKVTLGEFENYYANIGASIDNDDYFELMIRNAWHISGGEGWSANSANRRVLVTHSDGRESVEEIKDDMGLRAGDKSGAIARLRKQGLNSSSISFADGSEENVKNSDEAANIAKKSIPNLRTASSTTSSRKDAESHSKAENQALPPEVEVALRGPVANAPESLTSFSAPSTISRSGRGSVLSSTPDYGLQMIINKIKSEMKSRGAHGFVGMQRKFRIMDDDGSKALSMGEFKKALTEMKINITEREMRQLFDHFDKDQSGAIDFEEFLQGVRDPLNERRRKLVHMAFSKLDKQNDGCVEPEDIIEMYDATNHPNVISGKCTEIEIMQEFLDTFDVGEQKDGKVTRGEFENYYTNIGANIDNDDYFELMIRNAWHISGGEGWSANSANRRVLVTHSDGRESVEEIADDAGVRGGDRNAIIEKLRAQGIHAASVEFFNASDKFDGEVRSKSKRLFTSRQTSGAPAGVLPGTGAPLANKTSTVSPGQKRKTHEPPVAVQTIIRKIKDEMKSRGAHGFIGMQRRFRLMDDDGSKSLDMAEFRKAMNEMNIKLPEADLRHLFMHFDSDQSGLIDFEEFIQGVRDPLSEKRAILVGMAFKKIDKDRSGVVDATDIAACYDASKHPEVIAGRMTAEQAFRQFLDTFDVGGEVDGKVTRKEFENYYTNIGANIDNDDYFELMIRNAWHISGGEGWSANSANRRVLVTHSDGRESVEEIKDDMGLRAGDKSAAMSRLHAQSTHATDVNSSSYVEDKDVKKPIAMNLGHMSKLKKNDPGRYGSTAGASTRGPANLMQDTLQLKPSSQPRPQTRRSKERAQMNHGLANIIRMFKLEMKSRGAHGFVGLQRKFRVMDDDSNKSLNMAEFKKGLKEMNLAISDSEIRMLFEYFDADESGSIDFEEFLQGVRDPLNEKRRNLVRTAFKRMDRNGSGIIDGTDLIDTFDASKHPDVLSGKKSAHDVMEEFLDTFDVGGVKDGKVTLGEFENYYTNIGANIDNDDYFELMIRNAWHISGGEGWSANSANRRVLVTHADGRQSVEEIKDDMGLRAGDSAGAIARLRKQGVMASSINLYGGYDDSQPQSAKNPSSFRELVESGRAGRTSSQVRESRPYTRKKSDNTRVFQSSICIGDDGENAAASAREKVIRRIVLVDLSDEFVQLQGGIKRTHVAYDSKMSGAAMAVDTNRGNASVGDKATHPSSLANVSLTRNRDVPSMIRDLKQQLASRGSRGIIGLSRKFKSMDDNGNGALSPAEFRKALRECAIELSEQDFRVLFTHFDKDRSGDIDFEELLHALRGDMPARRQKLVNMAFDKMDKDGNGTIDPEDVIDTYDASKHPDVLAGKKTSDEVLREFLDTFDVGGEVDGKVTRSEFMNYYSNVGASIDDDDYFELMIRNAWHISGGEGWSANSANRRVLVTHADGRQSVEEIKDDMGLRAGDDEGAIARLRAQGVKASSISMHDGIDTRRKPNQPSATYRTTFTLA